MGLIRKDLPEPPAWPPPRELAAVQATLDYARRRDPVGHKVHTALAAFYLVTLPVSTALSGISFALLLGYALLRLPNTWRCYSALLRMPVLWALAAWVAFGAITIAWSSDAAQGWDEIRAARAILVPAMLWPVLDRAPWLISAALVGVALQNTAQLCQGLGVLGFEPGENGRLEGTLHPIQTGAWCAAAMCWHANALVLEGGRRRVIAIVGFAAAAAGLITTGSRGPWIAAAAGAPILVIAMAIRRPAARRALIAMTLLGVVAMLAAWPIARRMVEPRVERALEEIRAAREDGIYWTSAGLRIGLWRWAWEIYREAPVLGKGAGSFQDQLDLHPEYAAIRAKIRPGSSREDWMTRDHAHSIYLQTLATRGAIGGFTLLLVIVLLIRRCALDRPDHPYSDAALAILVTWLVGAQFDCYDLAGHLCGLLGLLAAVTLPRRPALRPLSLRWTRQ